MKFLFFIFFLFPSTLFAQYKFSLPEESGFQSGQTYVLSDQLLRLFSNSRKNETYLEYYNLNSGRLHKRIMIKGTHGSQTFHIGSDQTIWLFNENKAEILQVKNGKITKKYAVFDQKNIPKSGYFDYFIEMRNNPAYLFNNKIYLIKSFTRTAKIPIVKNQENEFICSIDLKTHAIKNNTPLPELFFERDYGMLNRFSSCRKGNVLIIAPNFSNEIILFNLENGNVVYPMIKKSDPYFNPAKPMFTKDQFDLSEMSEEMLDRKMDAHYDSNSEYLNILYDPYKRCYYRTLRVRDPKTSKNKNMKIIVLNEKFQYVKSKDLSADYAYYGMFVSKKGLNVFNHNEYKKNNKYLVFDTIEL